MAGAAGLASAGGAGRPERRADTSVGAPPTARITSPLASCRVTTTPAGGGVGGGGVDSVVALSAGSRAGAASQATVRQPCDDPEPAGALATGTAASRRS